MKSKQSSALIVVLISSIAFSACNADTASMNTAQTTSANAPPQTSTETVKSADIARAHGGGGGGRIVDAPSQSPSQTAASSPSRPMMGTPIDTSQYDREIARLEAAAKTGNEATKKELAQAYLARAKALTGAQQYRSALGDYRRTLKYDAGNSDANSMESQIIVIFKSLNREAPAPGTEPAPLPYTKQ